MGLLVLLLWVTVSYNAASCHQVTVTPQNHQGFYGSLCRVYVACWNIDIFMDLILSRLVLHYQAAISNSKYEFLCFSMPCYEKILPLKI